VLNLTSSVIVVYMAIRTYERSTRVRLLLGGKDQVSKLLVAYQSFITAVLTILIFPFVNKEGSDGVVKTLLVIGLMLYF